MRNAFLLVAVLFCLLFGGMTAVVASQSSFDIFSLISFVIIGLILFAVLGAIRNPPK